MMSRRLLLLQRASTSGSGRLAAWSLAVRPPSIAPTSRHGAGGGFAPMSTAAAMRLRSQLLSRSGQGVHLPPSLRRCMATSVPGDELATMVDVAETKSKGKTKKDTTKKPKKTTVDKTEPDSTSEVNKESVKKPKKEAVSKAKKVSPQAVETDSTIEINKESVKKPKKEAVSKAKKVSPQAAITVSTAVVEAATETAVKRKSTKKKTKATAIAAVPEVPDSVDEIAEWAEKAAEMALGAAQLAETKAIESGEDMPARKGKTDEGSIYEDLDLQGFGENEADEQMMQAFQDFMENHSDLVKEREESGYRSDEEGPPPAPLLRACLLGVVAEVKVLLAVGAPVNAADPGGWTALMAAASEGQTDCMQVLVQAGADVDARDNDGCTAIMHAASENRVDAIKALIAAGADINQKDNEQQPALMHAVAGGHFESVQTLLEAGADILHRNVNNLSALDLATHLSDEKLVNYLFVHTAEANKKKQ